MDKIKDTVHKVEAKLKPAPHTPTGTTHGNPVTKAAHDVKGKLAPGGKGNGLHGDNTTL
eukprot:CAMPEP_0206148820 /NCGR_PEP_ID=MMETSP1473-20131121/37452_1 /ASSEMBLY_ACC=CAM_ASM_001109 /TAXON_ID=1461547 /ORGANISM="Stichococcus sp, Strain RCC1054" /LENGTH=58 /DNA_ID=CAMNT_0053546243 /DNA_START=76 /DNA_END=252 /DNA_ORIENTATION=+